MKNKRCSYISHSVCLATASKQRLHRSIAASIIFLVLSNQFLGANLYGGVKAFLLNKYSSDIPVLTECTGKCLQVHAQTCLGKTVPLRGWNRYVHKKGIANAKIIPSGATVHNLTGTVVVLRIRFSNNINHAFHDDLWGVLAYGSRRASSSKLTIAYTSNVSWVVAVLELAAAAYDWQLIDATKGSSVVPDPTTWFCASDAAYRNGIVRNIHHYRYAELSRIRSDLRHRALQHKEVTKSATSMNVIEKVATTKERIIIFTREDTPWRQLKHVEFIIARLDTDHFSVHIVHQMPESFNDQVELFNSAALLIAPNGGWAPNVLWMSDEACLMEIHLYRTDSWIRSFGLASLFETGNFMTVTGNYHDESASPRVVRPHRRGGDDEIQGELVVEDLVRALQKSQNCRRFLIHS